MVREFEGLREGGEGGGVGLEQAERFREVAGIFEKEPKLIQLPSHGKGVFVGDTHGDLDATERVLSRFLGERTPWFF